MSVAERKLVPFSVRFGHATNSSSTHSVVIAPPGTKDDPYDSSWTFGWEPFVAASPEAKRLYAAAQLYAGLESNVDDDFARAALAATLCGLGLEHVGDIHNACPDHQSVWPTPPAGEDLKLWVSEMLSFLMRPEIAVVGGNDNDPLPLEKVLPGAKPLSFNIPMPDNQSVRVRRDPVYGYWTVYNPETGARVRFRWNEDPIPPRASIPELVDLKITGYCDYECSFCYQSSGPRGKHAGPVMNTILRDLRDLRVFEVVFGGGEPTKHPEFMEHLKLARAYKLTAAFTTRDAEWVRRHADSLRGLIRAVGISCSTVDDVTGVELVSRAFERGHIDVVVHLVPELYGSREAELWRILDACELFQLPVLFLGLKQVGRAANMKPRLPRGFWERMPRLWARVDTLFAKRYEKNLKDLYVSPILYDLDDGAWSCYIDAVDGTIGPNSYSPPWAKLDMRDSAFIGRTFRERGDAEESVRRAGAEDT